MQTDKRQTKERREARERWKVSKERSRGGDLLPEQRMSWNETKLRVPRSGLWVLWFHFYGGSIMMVSFLFICVDQRERRSQMGSWAAATGHWGGPLKCHYHLLPFLSCFARGITLVMRSTWIRWVLAASVTNPICERHANTRGAVWTLVNKINQLKWFNRL